MRHPILTYTNGTGRTITNHFLKKEVDKAERRLRNSGTLITNGKVIAEQTLGFWTDLFEVHHYRILLGKPIQIFNFLPSGVGRREIVSKLNKVRRFRNRINHNEPICFAGNTLDFTETLDVYNCIVTFYNI